MVHEILGTTSSLNSELCSVNCGYGTRSRIRYCRQCRSCAPSDNRYCNGGLSKETEKCLVIVCTGTYKKIFALELVLIE